MTKWFILLGLTLFVCLFLWSIHLIYLNKSEPKKIIESQVSSEPTPIISYQYSAWVPNWASPEEVTVSLFHSQKKLSTLLPSWYLLNSEGKLVKQEPLYKAQVIKLTNEYGIKVLPTIENQFNPKGVNKLISSKKLQAKTVEELILIAKENNYSGWDLDWEQIEPADKEKFNQFVAFLKQELAKENLLLSVTVHAQTGTSDDWDKSLGHDYDSLGKEADFIRVMVYDFHHPKSEPGPITPPDKLREVLNYATKNIPKEKIIVGLPTYGYDWSGKKPAVGLQYNEILKKMINYEGYFEKNEENLALYGEYTYKGINHKVWFEDATTIKQKQEIASSEFGLNNFCFWRLGNEDENLWSD